MPGLPQCQCGEPRKKLRAAARWLYDARQTETPVEAFAAFGLQRPSEHDPQHELWAENVPAWRVFTGMATQWQIGMSGPVGLRYEALPVVLRASCVPRADWPQVFEDVRVMELEALAVMKESRT